MNKSNKTKNNKSRIIFIMGIIFFVTSILTKIHNTRVLLKENTNNPPKVILNNPSNKISKTEVETGREEINYILEISDTLGEALNYVKLNYNSGTNIQTISILKDSIEGLNCISVSLENMPSNLENIKLETSNLALLIIELTHLLEENNIEMAETIIDSNLLSGYNHWKKSIENELR